MKPLTRKYLLIAGITLLTMVTGLLSWQLFSSKKEIVPKSNEPRLVLYNTQLIGREKGKPSWEITSPRVELSDDQQTTYFKDNPSGFFSGEGGNRFFWQAHSATYTSFDKRLVLETDVEGRSDNGDTFSTTRAVWEKSALHCAEPLEIRSGGMKIRAGKMDSDVSLNRFSVTGGIKGEDADEGLTLTSSAMVYQKSNRMAEFSAPMQVAGKDYRMESPSGTYDLGRKLIRLSNPRLVQKDPSDKKNPAETRIAADRMEGDQKKKEFSFSGNVQGERQGKYLTKVASDRMVYHQETGNFELFEKVSIQQKDKKIKGDQALFIKEKQELTVTGNVLILSEKGEWLKAQKAILNTETNQLESSGRVKGKILIKEE